MTAPALSPREFDHAAEVVRLVERFEDGTLPKGEWTHEAHLTVALWYASRLPFEAALVAVRDGIQRINADARRGHDADRRLPRDDHPLLHAGDLRIRGKRGRETGSDWAARVNRLLARYGARDLPLRHYTKDRLMSAEARFGWVEPDLRPIS